MGDVMIFAPAPTLTVTVEDHPDGSDVHVHAGGQGVWQARMLRRLGADVTMCSVLTGETGRMVLHLLRDEGLDVVAIEREGRGSVYVHDRRDGHRVSVVEEEGDPIGRHELDELYSATLAAGLAAQLAILSGPAGERALPPGTYRRLAADLRKGGTRVVVDLAGGRLEAALEGGIDVLKVSDEELMADGRVAQASVPALMRAMRDLQAAGAATVIVSRSEQPLLLLDEEGFLEVTPPELQVADTRGAGDSLTAGMAAAMARGESPREAVTLGAAAGALNVTRHGLGTGDAGAIARLREAVTARPLADALPAELEQPNTGRVSPDGLAALAEPADDEPADAEPEEKP